MKDQQTEDRICHVVTPEDSFTSRQGLINAVGISASSVGSKGLHTQIVKIPLGGRAKAHKHESHETALYALSGMSHVWHGDRLQEHSVLPPGSFVFIPADVSHLPYNPSATEAAVMVVARTDPSEQESVVLLPDLEDRAA